MIGIVGGTFDPVHNGHILPVHRLSEEIAFVRIHFVLCARPPHREPPRESVEHRWNMLELALDPHPLFVADKREIARPGPSYTVDTLTSMREGFGDHPLCLILGLDAYLGLQHWHRWQEIGALANIVVLSRPGWESNEEPRCSDLARLQTRASGLVVFWSGVEMPVSSTEVRRRLRAGADLGGQVPPPVLQYIYENRLYGVSKHE